MKQKIDSSLLDHAILYAVHAHANVARKGKGFPYIVHPLEAMTIVSTITSDQELLAASVLHDTIEDTDTTFEQLKAEFGQRIAEIVEIETNINADCPENDDWYFRKNTSIEKISTAYRDAQIVALGDKLSNMRAIALDYDRLGEDLWQRFRVKDKDAVGWYYQSLVKALSPLADIPAYQEFKNLVVQVFG